MRYLYIRHNASIMAMSIICPPEGPLDCVPYQAQLVLRPVRAAHRLTAGALGAAETGSPLRSFPVARDTHSSNRASKTRHHINLLKSAAELLPSRLFHIADMPAAFSDLSDREVEVVAEALKGTTSLTLFSRVSKACRSAAVCVAKDEASLRRLKARDVVCSVELVKWAIEQGCPREDGRLICAFAARGGHLETLQWLRASGFEWEWRTCLYAARGGHHDVLKWARGNGCPWDEETCSYAARGGHLGVLKWARANGCEWDGYTCSYAAMGGHLDVLKWARGNGCPWNAGTCNFAAMGDWEATWTSSSGPEATAALGMLSRVRLQPREATWTSSSGPGPTAASGMKTHVTLQPREATWTSSSGPGPTDAPGMRKNVVISLPGRIVGRSTSG